MYIHYEAYTVTGFSEACGEPRNRSAFHHGSRISKRISEQICRIAECRSKDIKSRALNPTGINGTDDKITRKEILFNYRRLTNYNKNFSYYIK